MKILRPVKLSDHNALIELAFSANEAITSLPKDNERLLNIIQVSENSFKGKENPTGHTKYLFVMEDLENKRLLGASALKSDNSYTEAFTSFYLKGDGHPPSSLNLCASHTPSTELATLFLHRDCRKSGLSKLLVIGRYLYVADFPLKFHEIFIARLRGSPRPETTNPSFWEQMGLLFDKNPHYPIHINKFTEEVKELIGKVHPKTIPAYHMLKKQGFVCPQIFDFYDTGPRLECKRDEIHSIYVSQNSKVESIADIEESSETFIISNAKKDHVVCMSKIRLSQKKPSHVIIPSYVANALSVAPGDLIRYTPSNLPSKEL